MKTKQSWILGIVIAIAIIIGIVWYMSKPSYTETGDDAAQPAQTDTQSIGASAPTAAAPMGIYPIHILANGPSVYYTPVNSATGTTGTSIMVNNPPTNTIIGSPLSITGSAKGSWFFEATFSAILTDASGKILARATVAALDNWQTADFVPFAGKMSFPEQKTGSRGVLILRKDNPSGLAANDASIEIQVTFK